MIGCFHQMEGQCMRSRVMDASSTSGSGNHQNMSKKGGHSESACSWGLGIEILAERKPEMNRANFCYIQFPKEK